MAEQFLRLEQVREKTGLCRSAVYGLEGFPRPVKLGTSRAVAWVASEVDFWVDAQIAARQNCEAGAK
jgi:predicted DNA-binding transcriptional regulator AlpA